MSLVLLVEAIIGLTVLEGLALALYHRLTGRGVAPADFAAGLAAGIALMLALRAALGGAGWPWVGAAVSASGLLHAADVARRWSRAGKP
jgi:hypothetical protein